MSILVVLDTNIVVSAGIQPALHSARIVDAALAGLVVPVLCPAIAADYIEAVNHPRFKTWKQPPLWLNALVAGAHVVEQDQWPSPGHPDDKVFLALAHRTGAILVTGSMADYPKDIRHGGVVMDPGTYVQHLEFLGVRW